MPVNMNRIINIIPTLVEATGSGYKESGLVLTTDQSLPYGKVYTFKSADDVKAYFGPQSPLFSAATVYFNGPDNKTKVPEELLISTFNKSTSKAWLRSAQVEQTVTELKTISNGYITLVIDGVESLIEDIDFSGDASYTEMAATMQVAVAAVHSGYTVTYDLIREAFVITGTTAEEIGYAVLTVTSSVGTDLATVLGFTATAGAVISEPFAGSKTIADIMDQVCLMTENWFSFTTDWEPLIADRLEFADWNSQKYSGRRFCYVAYDMDGADLVSSSSADFATVAKAAGYAAILPLYGNLSHAMFVLGCGASVNRAETNGRYALAGKHQSGLTVTCDNTTDFDTLIAKGYSCYADFATAGNLYRWLQNGAILGDYKWFDALQGHVWLNDNIQVNCANLIDQVKAFPYNQMGYSMIDSALTQAANEAINNGVAVKGVVLSESQKTQIMAELGFDISDALFAAGFYNYIVSPTAAVRAERGSPIVRFYYNDGGVIQKIDVVSAAIQ
jgi:hypothetical protein